MFVLYGLVALCSLAGISAEEGNVCGNYTSLQDFNLTKYLGSWWQQGKNNYDMETDCKQVIWSIAPSGNIKISKRFLATNSLDMYENIIKGSVPDPSKPGHIVSVYDGHYLILGTDYTSYAVNYYCNLADLEVATRDKYPPASVIDKAKGFMKEHGIDTEMRYHSLNNCDIPQIKAHRSKFFRNDFFEGKSRG